MSLQVAQVPGLLGAALEQFWVPDKVGARLVSCVTVVRDVCEAGVCQGGELLIVMPGGDIAGRMGEVVDLLVARRAAAVLAPAPALSRAETIRLRDPGARHELAVGLLSAEAGARDIANTLGRALGATQIELALSALHGADALQTLAETLGRLVGNSVTIESPQHKLLAFSATHGPVDRVREETILRRQGSPRTLAWVTRAGYIAELFKADRPIRIPANPELGYDGRVAMRVAAEDEVLAVIWVTESARLLDERDEAVIQQATEAAAAILLQQRAAVQKEAELRTELLEDVVHGRIVGLDNIRALARNLGWDIDRLRHLFVVTIDDLEALRLHHAGQNGRRLQRVRERLTEVVRLETLAIDPLAVIGPRSTGVIVLLATARTTHADEATRKAALLRLADRIVKRAAAHIPDMSVTVGVGRDFPSFEHIPDAFRQAELAARLGATLWGGNRAVHYADLGVHRVLFALQEHEEMIPPALQRLLDHDARHHTDYVRTLAAYLSCMGRLRVAAEQLAIHRNTLEYRMQRIEELAGEPLDDPNNRLALELGIRLLDMRRKTGPASPLDTG